MWREFSQIQVGFYIADVLDAVFSVKGLMQIGQIAYDLGCSLKTLWPQHGQVNIYPHFMIERPYMDSSSFANNPSSSREVRLLTYIRSRTAAPVPGAGP